MQKILSILFFLSSVAAIISCVSCNKLHYPQYTVNSILPRESFVKIEVSLTAENKTSTLEEPIDLGKAVASGMIIKKTSKGSYILTADHVCKNDVPKIFTSQDYNVDGDFKALDIDNNKYKAIIYDQSNDIDACILFAKALKKHPAIKLRERLPNIGDKVYNVAAPAGFFDKNMVPIFEGRYSGSIDGHDIYTIPSMGGSSGSPVVDEKGYLIGMIFAVHRRFPMISFSPTTEDLYEFLKVIKRAPNAPLEPQGPSH